MMLSCKRWNGHLILPVLSFSSLHIPDFTEQRGEFVVVDSPGCQHLCVVVVKRSQLCQAAQETSEVLWLQWMLQGAQLPQHIQHGLLKSLYSLLILHIRTVWKRDVSGLLYWYLGNTLTKQTTVNTVTQRLTWAQDCYGGEESLFLLDHMEFTNAFVEVEHRCDKFFWNTCRKGQPRISFLWNIKYLHWIPVQHKRETWRAKGFEKLCFKRMSKFVIFHCGL